MDRPFFKDMSDLNEEQQLFFKIEQLYTHLHGNPHHLELRERLMKLSIMNLDEEDENSYS